jgi:hypothetical protein
MISQRPPPQAAGTVQMLTALSACRHSESLFFFVMANQALENLGLAAARRLESCMQLSEMT